MYTENRPYYAVRREGQIFGITQDMSKALTIAKNQAELTPNIKVWMESVENLDEERLYCPSYPKKD